MRKRLLLIALVAVLVALAPAPAEARTSGRSCVPIRATGIGQDQGNGRTTATIFVRGVEVGTTAASFTITGIDGTTASFVGPITFTSDIGTITAETAGTFDTVTGAFVSRSSDLTGTDFFDGVTGRVVLRGTQDLTTGSFTERLSGRLCLPRS